MRSWVDVSSSKAACRRRRQAARREQYRQLRKAGRVPQHTRAERARAAAERERQREVEQRRLAWLGRVTGPVVTTVGAAAGLILGAPGTGVIGHVYHPYSAVSQFYPYAPLGPGFPDPHTPERDVTLYTAYDRAGTARTHISIWPVRPGSWNPWAWTDGLQVRYL